MEPHSLMHFVSTDVVVLIVITQSQQRCVWDGICLTCVHNFPFSTFWLKSSNSSFFFLCIVKTSHSHFSQNRSHLLQDYTAQDVLHQYPGTFFNSSTTLHFLTPFKAMYLNTLIVWASLPSTQATLKMFLSEKRGNIPTGSAALELHRPRWHPDELCWSVPVSSCAHRTFKLPLDLGSRLCFCGLNNCHSAPRTKVSLSGVTLHET